MAEECKVNEKEKNNPSLWRRVEGLARWLVNRLLGLVGREFSQEQWKALWQFVEFGLVGLSNTLISYVVYLLGISLGLHYLAASVLGFVVCVQNAFYWNN